MKKELPRKPKNKDIKFIDPQTMEVVCTYNECRKKFQPASETRTRTPKWGTKRFKVTYESYFWACEECGRTHASRDDMSRTAKSYKYNALTGAVEINESDRDNKWPQSKWDKINEELDVTKVT